MNIFPKKILLPITILLITRSVYAQDKPLEAIPGQFIVVLNESIASPVIKQQKKNIDRQQKQKDNEPARFANMKKLKDVRVKHKIEETSLIADFADVLVGFSAKLSSAEVEDLKKDKDIEGVYQDYKIT